MSTPVDAITTDQPFSVALREATTADHSQAEGGPFLGALFSGELGADALREMSVQHLLVYRALETAGAAHRGDATACAVQLPALARVAALTHDVELLGGPGALAALRPLPATAEYVARLDATADWPAGFVAHHYTRLLGDLSGGLHIGRAIRRVHPDVELRFYDFGDLDAAATKAAYRAALDAAPWDDDERRRVIDEVHVAYDLNTRLFADLAAATLS